MNNPGCASIGLMGLAFLMVAWFTLTDAPYWFALIPLLVFGAGCYVDYKSDQEEQQQEQQQEQQESHEQENE